MRFKFVFSAEWPSLPQCLALCLNIIIHSFILAPFLQLVVESAHPAVGRVLGYTTVFGFGFLVILFSFLFLFVFVVLRVPLLTLGPPGWSSAGGDARRDE